MPTFFKGLQAFPTLLYIDDKLHIISWFRDFIVQYYLSICNLKLITLLMLCLEIWEVTFATFWVSYVKLKGNQLLPFFEVLLMNPIVSKRWFGKRWWGRSAVLKRHAEDWISIFFCFSSIYIFWHGKSLSQMCFPFSWALCFYLIGSVIQHQNGWL